MVRGVVIHPLSRFPCLTCALYQPLPPPPTPPSHIVSISCVRDALFISVHPNRIHHNIKPPSTLATPLKFTAHTRYGTGPFGLGLAGAGKQAAAAQSFQPSADKVQRWAGRRMRRRSNNNNNRTWSIVAPATIIIHRGYDFLPLRLSTHTRSETEIYYCKKEAENTPATAIQGTAGSECSRQCISRPRNLQWRFLSDGDPSSVVALLVVC